MSSVTYGKCIMLSVIMANETEPQGMIYLKQCLIYIVLSNISFLIILYFSLKILLHPLHIIF